MVCLDKVPSYGCWQLSQTPDKWSSVFSIKATTLVKSHPRRPKAIPRASQLAPGHSFIKAPTAAERSLKRPTSGPWFFLVSCLHFHVSYLHLIPPRKDVLQKTRMVCLASTRHSRPLSALPNARHLATATGFSLFPCVLSVCIFMFSYLHLIPPGGNSPVMHEWMFFFCLDDVAEFIAIKQEKKNLL